MGSRSGAQDRKTALIYLRQSVDRSGEEEAVERQLEDAESLAAARGFTVRPINDPDISYRGALCDNDRSAKAGSVRPAFERLLQELEAGGADVIICWNMARLLRNARDRYRMSELCREKRVDICMVRGSDMLMDTPSGRLMAGILGEVALHEIEEKSDRQRRANEQAAAKGRRVGGRRPFGFGTDGITVRPAEAKAIVDGYHALLAGTSLAAIARDWNARGFTAQSGPWAHYNVRMVLANPRYKGARRYVPVNGAPHFDRSDRRKGQLTKAEWPALIDDDTWAAVNDIIEGRSAAFVPRNPKLLLTGEALCGVCGATVHGGGTTHKYRAYRCSANYGHVSRKAEPVDQWVEAHAIARLKRPDAIDLLAPPDTTTGMLRLERQRLAARREAVRDEFVDDDTMRPGDLRKMLARFGSRISEIDAKLASTARASVLRPVIGAEDVEATWRELPVPHRRTIIGLLMEVKIHPVGRGVRYFRPESVEITPRKPDAHR